jgi:subtilisin family serine protease
LIHDPAVRAVEEDHRVHLALTPNDTFWYLQWGPETVRAPAAWGLNSASQTVVVAVLDTGIDQQHDDLAGQLWVNPGEIPGNGQDDDGNNYVDDVHGWNVLDAGSNAIQDDHGHGTHVGGIIAARGNNGQGIAGMAWESRVMVVKVLDQYGDGYYSGLAAGLIYAADNGAQVANLSLGGTVSSQILQDAVNYAHAKGTLVVAATGNTNSAVQYPAACDNVLAIAASTRHDERASYSCYGAETDLTAPGSSIYSTCNGGAYCFKSGTSMAAPHVAGLAALIYAQHPTLTPDQVAQLLRETAQDIGDPGWDPYTGWGRIDAYRALVKMNAQFHYYFPLVQMGS